jgi:hypothetical protein
MVILDDNRKRRPQEKTLPLGPGGFLNGLFSRLGAQNVCRLEAFGALEQIKLHGLSLVERAIAVLLDCGEVHEHILSRGALDEPISFRPVEPLDCSLLSHGKTPFPLVAINLFAGLSTEKPRSFKAPSNHRRTRLRVIARKKRSQKEKTPQFSCATCGRGGNFRSPIIGAFLPPNSTSTYLLVSPPDRRSGYEQKIISSIKTIRKKN